MAMRLTPFFFAMRQVSFHHAAAVSPLILDAFLHVGEAVKTGHETVDTNQFGVLSPVRLPADRTW